MAETADVGPATMSRHAEDELKDIWRRCFPDEARTDADARVRGEAEWCDQRPTHLPLTRDVMKTKLSASLRFGVSEQEDGEPTLLLMAGYSPEQLALVVGAHVEAGCTAVVPFTGRGVWNAVQAEVASCLSILNVDGRVLAQPVEVDPASPVDVFRKIIAWVRRRPTARCAIECTGGKKPMDSGAAHAASFYGLPAYYLDFDRYDSGLRRPLPWTCVYRELPRPDDAFGLASRMRVFEAFRGRRFADASLVMTDVVQRAQASGFFEGEDLDELRRARGLVAEAAAWMDLRYHEIPDHPLAPAFAQAAKTEPRRLVEDLLAANRFDDLFHYLSDEYWRLGLLFDAGEVREALVGLVGLAEIAVDGMFRAPWFAAARVAHATAVEWLGVADAPALPDLSPWEGKTMPLGWLPPSSFGPKVRLLRRGATTFDVWAWTPAEGAELPAEPPSWNDERLVVRVDVALDREVRPPLGGPSNRIWKDWFGDFPQGGWVQNRHALAHLRAPLLAERAVEQATQAREVFVPRLIEVLRRLHAGESLDTQGVEQGDWPRWQQEPPWRKADRMPWIEKLSDLERWLRLRL